MKFQRLHRGALQAVALLVLSAAALLSAPLARAGALSDYLENALVGHVFRGTPYTAPGTIYVGLFTTACSDAAPGTEPSSGGYARVGVAANTSNWAATNGTNGTTSNVNVISFATPTAGWGTVAYFGLFDALSGGNMLICSPLTSSKAINSGDAVSFAAGALTVQIDN